MRRDGLVRIAREIRGRCQIEDPDDPFIHALLEARKALLILVHDNGAGASPGPIWARIDDRIGALVMALKKLAAADGKRPS